MSAPTTATSYTTVSYSSPSLYSATLSSLPVGNKQYFYSCGSDQIGFSPVQSFKTHPGLVEDVTFFVVGDVGQTANSVNTITELVEYEQLLTTWSGGIISMGDLSYANGIHNVHCVEITVVHLLRFYLFCYCTICVMPGVQPLWDTFGNLYTAAAAKIPFHSTLGNHEWGETAHKLTAYTSRFQNPKVDGVKELYYSFDAGLVHFVMVAGYCSEMVKYGEQPCLRDGSKQKEWLWKDLGSVDRSVTPWVVVSFHQPFVNSNTAHSIEKEGLTMQAAIEDVLFENKVDLVFSGHVHVSVM